MTFTQATWNTLRFQQRSKILLSTEGSKQSRLNKKANLSLFQWPRWRSQMVHKLSVEPTRKQSYPVETSTHIYSLSYPPSQFTGPIQQNQKRSNELSSHYQLIDQHKASLQINVEQSRNWTSKYLSWEIPRAIDPTPEMDRCWPLAQRLAQF